MATMWMKLRSVSWATYRSQRCLSVAAALNAKTKTQGDPIKQLFLDKLADFKSKGSVSYCTLYII